MPVTVVVGGQFGSEGKGKLVAHLAFTQRVDIAVRCGGPNAGHSVLWQGRTEVLRQVPTAVVCPTTRLLIAAGAVVDPPILLREIGRFALDKKRIGIDPDVAIISRKDRQEEMRLGLHKRIASTLSGTGSVTARKILRDSTLRLARQIPKLKPFLADVAEEINEAIDLSKKIVIEGTQGLGLSLHHSRNYPYATSRDTSASNFLSEAGVSPLCVNEIIMVVRSFPIRVAGKSGPLRNEISWRQISRKSGTPNKVGEFTNVTNRLRRVALFDHTQTRRAVRINRPTALALQGVDYINFADRGKRNFQDLSDDTRAFISEIENQTSVPVKFIFTGPALEDVIEKD